VLALFVALGFPARAAQADAPINTMCPVLEDEPSDPDIVVEYEGHTIAFCCQRCRRDFLADPAPYADWIAARLAEQAPAVAPGPEASGPAAPGPMAPDPIAPNPGAPGPKTRGQTATPPAPTSPWSARIRRLGRFHPLLVHFPIALFLAAAAAEALFALRGRPGHAASVRFCLALGAAGALTAALLGWAAAFQRNFPADQVETVFRHRWLGTATAVLGVLTWIVCRRAPAERSGRGLLRAALGLLVVLVVVGAHFGGVLAYGPDYLFG